MIKQPLVISGDKIVELGSGDYLAGMIAEVKNFSGSAMPHGWLACEGQTLAVENYPELFVAIGNQYGGDGISYFALPNRRSGGTAKQIMYTGVYPSIVQSVSVPAVIHGPAGYFKTGDTLSFNVQLLEGIAVSGGPVQLHVDIGGTAHTLAFTDGTATDWIFADYVVQPGDGGAVAATLNLNGAALLTVADGHAATLSIGSYAGANVDTTAPAAPTVNALSTTSHTPTITGTATVLSGETLKVTVNSIAYTVGDGNLSLSGTAWSLTIPEVNALSAGTYNVSATVTDLAGNVASDSTSGELVITA